MVQIVQAVQAVQNLEEPAMRFAAIALRRIAQNPAFLRHLSFQVLRRSILAIGKIWTAKLLQVAVARLTP
jgi:hypothetical protein